VLLVPLIDRSPYTDPRRRKLMMGLMLVAVVVFVGLMMNAALQPPVSHL